MRTPMLVATPASAPVSTPVGVPISRAHRWRPGRSWGASASMRSTMAETRRVCPTCGEAYGGEALFCPRDGVPLASRKPEAIGDPYLGLSIGGQIHLERLVGIGSMGRVYRASQAGIGRQVAVKILHREHTKRRALGARFLREGRVAGTLSHPNLITVHGSGEL